MGDAGMGGPFELKEAEWDRIAALNLGGSFLAGTHKLPATLLQRRGNISSLANAIMPGPMNTSLIHRRIVDSHANSETTPRAQHRGLHPGVA